MRRWLAAAALVATLSACGAPSANAPPRAPQPLPPAPVVQAPRPPATGSSAAAVRAPAAPGTSATPAPTASTQAGLSAWKRNHEGLEANAPVKDCLGCHEGTHIAVHSSHPVDVDYASAAGLAGSSLRAAPEAQQRGARLPGGKLHCLSCHDPDSPWKSHVALPANARVRAALQMGADDGSGEASAGRAQAQAAPPPGSAVNTMPLCQTCHTYGD